MEIKKNILSMISESLTVKTRNTNARPSNIYLNTKVMPANTEIFTGEENNHVLARNSAVAVVDLAPQYNWGHPCKHVLFDAETGEQYDSFDSQLPTSELYSNNADFKTIQEEVKVVDADLKIEVAKAKIPELEIEINRGVGERYALLFSGMSNRRHVNDLEFMYRVLVDVYKFDRNKIIVLNENGTVHHAESWADGPNARWAGNNTPYRMRVDGPGSKKVLIDTIRGLRDKIKSNDLLFIHTNNHGGRQNNQSTLCTWPNWDSVTANEFANELAKIPEHRSLVVMMEQCHSGGFMQPILNKSKARRIHFSAACRADRSSIGGQNFDPFALDWIAAMNGKYPTSALRSRADESYDNRVSASEAFAYAKRHKDDYDTPVTGEYPSGIGRLLYLDEPGQVVGNKNSKEFHQFGCCWVKRMSSHNMVIMESAQEAMNKGYNGCWYCRRKYDNG